MKRVTLSLTAIVSIIFLSGCAASVKYKFDKTLYVSESPKDFSVIIDELIDNRPAGEREGKLDGKKGYAITNDKMFKKNIPLQTSQMLAEHLTKAKVFRSVSVKDIANDLEVKPEDIAKLRSEGFDLAVLGGLNHFYGYYSEATSAALVPVLFGLIGALTEVMINSRSVGGLVEYGEVRIIDLNKGTVVWSGNVSHVFEDEVHFYDSAIGYVLKALKETNNKFSKELSESELK